MNALVYAFRRDAPQHRAYDDWLSSVLGRAEVGLVESVLLGVVRIVTNPRVLTEPAPTQLALRFVAALRAAPRARVVSATAATWATLDELVGGDDRIRGDLVPDAWLAALAISHGARLATADRGFGRYPGLEWFTPVVH